MKDLAEEPKEDIALVIVADDEPVMLHPEQEANEEAATMQECPYCGHYPCGCGG